MRPHGRKPDELRTLRFKRHYTRQAPGSVLVRMGRTTVLCTCCVEATVPPFLVGKGKGWLTAEYGMLPGSTNTRKARDQRRQGRWPQRRDPAAHRPQPAGDRQSRQARRADPVDRLRRARSRRRHPHRQHQRGVRRRHRRAGIRSRGASPRSRRSSATASPPSASACLDDVELLDLEYVEDRDAEVDLNLVMTGGGQFIEVQGTGEEATFSRSQLDRF